MNRLSIFMFYLSIYSIYRVEKGLNPFMPNDVIMFNVPNISAANVVGVFETLNILASLCMKGLSNFILYLSMYTEVEKV